MDEAGRRTRICLKLGTTELLEAELQAGECLAELRPLIAEHPRLKLLPNFLFFAGERCLAEGEPLAEQLPGAEGDRTEVVVRPGPLTPFLARRHLRECCAFLASPRRYIATAQLGSARAQGRVEAVDRWVEAAALASHTLPLGEYLTGLLPTLGRLSFLPKEHSPALFDELRPSARGPPGATQRLAGEFVLLEARTLEGKEVSLQVGRAGVWADGAGPFDSLPAALRAVSPRAAQQLDGLENELADTVAELGGGGSRWQARPKADCPRQKQLEAVRGLCAAGSAFYADNRDWNEELQICLALPFEDDSQELHRSRLLHRLLEEFGEAAKEVGQGAIEGELPPLAPGEQCFVSGTLFVTGVAETEAWEIPRADNSLPAAPVVQAELRNLSTALAARVPALHLVNGALVEYAGRRVLVQALIPGILHSEPQKWQVYGSLDEGKTLHAEREFGERIGELCAALNIRRGSTFHDAEGAAHVLDGSPDVKGMRASDGRLYALDLVRLSPRDANYAALPGEEGCVLRHELLQSWNAFCSMNKEQSLPLDPSLLTALESQNSSKEADLEALRRPAQHLLTSVLPLVAKEISANASVVDTSSLTACLHRFGINNRYLGKVHQAVVGETWAQNLIQRAVLVRSAVRKIRADAAMGIDFPVSLVHIVNCLVANKEVSAQIDARVSKKQFTPPLSPAADVVAWVLSVANKRFGLKIKDETSLFSSDHEKLCFVREVALSVGAILQPRPLLFDKEATLRLKDVVALRSRVKRAHLSDEGLFTALQAVDAYFESKEYAVAGELLRQCQQLIVLTRGICHRQMCEVMSKQASLAARLEDINLAIKRQLVALRIGERLFGLDDHRTLPLIMNLASYLFWAKRLPEALSAQGTALFVSQLIAGPAHHWTVSVLRRFEGMCSQAQDKEISLSLAQEMLLRSETLYGQSDERLLEILEKLAHLKSEAGLFTEACLLQARHRFILAHLLKIAKLEKSSPLAVHLQSKLSESVRRVDLFVKQRDTVSSKN